MRPICTFFIVSSFLFICACEKSSFEDYCQNNEPEFEERIKNDSIRIYIPTGFTPNQDGHNDRYYFVTKGIVKCDVKIKRRFTTVFEIKGANSDWYWDGKDKKGETKDGEYDVKSTLYAYDGEIIHLETKIASAQVYSDLPCSCSRPDQIDLDDGFVFPTAETCTNY